MTTGDEGVVGLPVDPVSVATEVEVVLLIAADVARFGKEFLCSSLAFRSGLMALLV
jgi:hypothetical protein